MDLHTVNDVSNGAGFHWYTCPVYNETFEAPNIPEMIKAKSRHFSAKHPQKKYRLMD